MTQLEESMINGARSYLKLYLNVVPKTHDELKNYDGSTLTVHYTAGTVITSFAKSPLSGLSKEAKEALLNIDTQFESADQQYRALYRQE